MSISSAQTAEFNQRRGLTTLLAESGGNMTPVVLAILYWLDTLAEKVKGAKTPNPRVTVAKEAVEKDEDVRALFESVTDKVREVIFDAVRNEDPRVSILLFDELSDIRAGVKEHRDLVIAGMNIKVQTEDGENESLPWDDIADVETAKESLKGFASMTDLGSIPKEFLTDSKDGPALNMKRWRALTTIADTDDAGTVAKTNPVETRVTTWNLNGKDIETTGLSWLAVFHASNYSEIITQSDLIAMIEDQTGKSITKYEPGESFTVTVPAGQLTCNVKQAANNS